jgi:hypothetical protein
MNSYTGYRWGLGEVHTGSQWENLRARNHLNDLGVDGSVNIKLDFYGKDKRRRLD